MPNTTGINQVDSLLAGPEFRWNADAAPGTAVSVTFSFPAELPAYADATDTENQGFSPFNTEQQEATRTILDRISSEFNCSGLLKLDTQLSGNLPLERSVHYEEKTHV